MSRRSHVRQSDPQQSQLGFFKAPKSLSFGGELSKGKRKSARVLSTRDPVHLVMRSSQAKGARSMLHKQKAIENIVRKQAQRWQVKVKDFVNVGNHLHLLIRIRSRRSYRGFVRSLSGLIARCVLGIERGKSDRNRKIESLASIHETQEKQNDHTFQRMTQKASTQKLQSSFWDALPFSRIVPAGRRTFNSVARYFQKNKLEALGFDRNTIRETRNYWIIGLPMRGYG